MISLAVLLLKDAHARFQRLRSDEDGASVLEWAMIAAIVVVAASVIGVVVMRIVNDKSSQLDDCASQPAGSACGP